MESWRHRKTLILGRTDMVGLLTPAEYNDCVEHAYRMHGLGRVYMEPKGHIVLDRYKGEWEVMPSYIEEPEAARLQVGLDPRGQRALRASRGLLDPHLHAPGDRLSARDLRRLVPHADAHRRLGRGLGEVARRPGLEGARDPRRGQRRRGQLATCDEVFAWGEVRVWSRSQASVDRFLAEQAPRYPAPAHRRHDRRSARRRAARTSSSPARTRASGSSTTRG